MRRLLLAVALSFPTLTAAAGEESFIGQTFEADLHVNEDASIAVHETIAFELKGRTFEWMSRRLEKNLCDPEKNKYSFDYALKKARIDGKSATVEAKDTENSFEMITRKSNELFYPGLYKMELDYLVKPFHSPYAEETVLFWPAHGNGWETSWERRPPMYVQMRNRWACRSSNRLQ